MFDPKHLNAFVVLAETMHFGRAAERLGVSQPALSLWIRALEEEVGAPLVNRSNRTLTLTPVGEGFLADAGRILAMMECARRNADDILSGEKAEVRLGVCPGVISSGILTNLLSRLRERHSHLRLIPETEPPRDLLERLLDGRLDGVVSVSCGLDFPPNVARFDFQSWDAVLVMPHQMAAGADTREKLVERMLAQTYVCLAGAETHPHIAEIFLGFAPRRTVNTPSIRLLMAYVDSGCGYAVVPEVDCAAKGPNTVVIPLAAGEKAMTVTAARLATSNGPALRRVFEVLGEIAALPALYPAPGAGGVPALDKGGRF